MPKYGSAYNDAVMAIANSTSFSDWVRGEHQEPNETPCPRCGKPVGWGRMTGLGRYDEASALMNHIETAHPEVEL